MDIEQRIEELSAEIRNYPTPIARCDEQLTALIEERSRLFSLIKSNSKPTGCTPEGIWANDGGLVA
jgi:chorismate mutase